MSTEDVALFREITQASEEEAKRYMEIFVGDVSSAVDAYLSSGSVDHHKPATPPPQAARTSPPPSNFCGPVVGLNPRISEDSRTAVAKADRSELKGNVCVKVYLPYRAADEDGGTNDPLQYRLLPVTQLGAVKSIVSQDRGIPAIVLRCIVNGVFQPDNNVTLASLGFKESAADRTVWNEILILHPPRDERGQVTLQNDSGATIMSLTEGEWNVSTSVTDIREAVATLCDEEPGNIRLVFNGLSLQDRTSFGLNGIAAGAVVTVLSLNKKKLTADPARKAKKRR